MHKKILSAVSIFLIAALVLSDVSYAWIAAAAGAARRVRKNMQDDKEKQEEAKAQAAETAEEKTEPPVKKKRVPVNLKENLGMDKEREGAYHY